MLIKPGFDAPLYDDTFQGLKSTLSEKLSQTLRCRESLNSSGTVSRKTSTASDYTPENTYVSHNRVDQSGTVPFAADISTNVLTRGIEKSEEVTVQTEVDGREQNDSLKDELNASFRNIEDVKLMPGQRVDLKVFILKSSENDDTKCVAALDVAPPEETIKAHEKPEAPATLKVPQRKISRFLVSPVLSGELDYPKDKEISSAIPSEKIQQVVEDDSNTITDVLKKNLVPTESTILNDVEKPLEQKVSVSSLKDDSITNKEEPIMCGPEMINTIEQLKISLDNLKNSMHPKKESSETDTKKIVIQSVQSSTTQQTFIAPTQLPQIPNQIPQQPISNTQAPASIVTQVPVQPPPSQPSIPQVVSQVNVTQSVINSSQATTATTQQTLNQPPIVTTSTQPVVVSHQTSFAPTQQQQQQQQPNQPNLILQQPPANYVQPIPQQQTVTSPPQMMLNIQQQPLGMDGTVATNVIYQQQSVPPKTVTTMTGSMSVQNLSLQQQQQFQQPISVDDTVVNMHHQQQGFALQKVPLPDGLKQISERYV